MCLDKEMKLDIEMRLNKASERCEEEQRSQDKFVTTPDEINLSRLEERPYVNS